MASVLIGNLCGVLSALASSAHVLPTLSHTIKKLRLAHITQKPS